jgi:hypothetical protein
MLSPLPRRSDWASCLLIHPAVSAFPDMALGSACASSFSRLARRSLALRPAHSRCHLFVTRITEGFNRFVTSTIAPVASGWSICRVGLAPTGKRHLFTAHTQPGHPFSLVTNVLSLSARVAQDPRAAPSRPQLLCFTKRSLERKRDSSRNDHARSMVRTNFSSWSLTSAAASC